MATPNVKRDRLHMRVWFAVYCLYLAAVALGSLWALDQSARTGAAWSGTVWLLGLMVFYLSLASTFVPVPTSWLILLMASPAGGLVMGPVWRVLAVASLGAMATAISHVNEYHLICYLLRLGKIHRVRETRAYRWAEGLFSGSPFLLQVGFNVLPLPADPARWMAIGCGYPLRKFFAAHWTGRFVRYGLMGLAAEVLSLTLWEIVGIQVVLLAIPAARIVVKRMTSRPEVPADRPATIAEEQAV